MLEELAKELVEGAQRKILRRTPNRIPSAIPRGIGGTSNEIPLVTARGIPRGTLRGIPVGTRREIVGTIGGAVSATTIAMPRGTLRDREKYQNTRINL